MAKEHMFTVSFIWQERDGTPLKEQLIRGVIKGIEDLTTRGGLLEALDIGRVQGEDEVVYLLANPDTGAPTAVNHFVVGELEMPEEMQEAAASAATVAEEAGGSLVVTEEDVMRAGVPYVIREKMGEA